jgi:hypothetical protein
MQLSDAEATDPVGVQHIVRFRRVANGYARRVALAYHGNVTAAALDTDDQVARTVADWERHQGFEPAAWSEIGRSEGRTDDDGLGPGSERW